MLCNFTTLCLGTFVILPQGSVVEGQNGEVSPSTLPTFCLPTYNSVLGLKHIKLACFTFTILCIPYCTHNI